MKLKCIFWIIDVDAQRKPSFLKAVMAAYQLP